jgi:hypothetical protein
MKMDTIYKAAVGTYNIFATNNEVPLLQAGILWYF